MAEKAHIGQLSSLALIELCQSFSAHSVSVCSVWWRSVVLHVLGERPVSECCCGDHRRGLLVTYCVNPGQASTVHSGRGMLSCALRLRQPLRIYMHLSLTAPTPLTPPPPPPPPSAQPDASCFLPTHHDNRALSTNVFVSFSDDTDVSPSPRSLP